MISEFFIDAGFGIADKFLSMLPDMTWSIETSAWEYAKDFLDMICYLLPLNTIRNIVSFIVAVAFVRIVISFARTIMGFIPFV